MLVASGSRFISSKDGLMTETSATTEWATSAELADSTATRRAPSPVAGVTVADGSVGADSLFLDALKGREPAVQEVARWFRADHLPPESLHCDVARAFQAFTLQVLRMIDDDSAGLALTLHKLLEAKDAAVRAAMS